MLSRIGGTITIEERMGTPFWHTIHRCFEVAEVTVGADGDVLVPCQGERHRVRLDGCPRMLDHDVKAEMAMLTLSDWRDPPPCVLVYFAAMRTIPESWNVRIRYGVPCDDRGERLGTMVDVTVRR